MSRIDDFSDQVRRIISGDPWYGDNILKILEGVTHEQAAQRPIPSAHSIWELVLHITSWMKEVARRLKHGQWGEPADGDWPDAPDPTAANWSKAIARLNEAHEGMLKTLEAFPASRLDEKLGMERNPAMGTGQTYAQMLHGILQHDAYHVGQIGILKKGLKT